MGKSVIIFGLGESRSQCPFDEETWGVNMSYNVIAQMKGRLDKLFIGHNPNTQYPYLLGSRGEIRAIRASDWGWNYIAGLAEKIDIISLHKIRGIKTRLYPLRRIKKAFETDYFSNTLCYMIAYAVYKKYTRIRIYGVDMKDKVEYVWEKPGIEYWIGFARGKGIQVDIAEGSSLLTFQHIEKIPDADYSEVQPLGKPHAIDG